MLASLLAQNQWLLSLLYQLADENLLKGNSRTCSHTMHQKCRLNCKNMSHSHLVQVDPSERNYKMTHSLIFNYSIMKVWCLFSLLLAPCSCWRGTHIWFLWRDCGQVLQSWWGRNIDCHFPLSAYSFYHSFCEHAVLENWFIHLTFYSKTDKFYLLILMVLCCSMITCHDYVLLWLVCKFLREMGFAFCFDICQIIDQCKPNCLKNGNGKIYSRIHVVQVCLRLATHLISHYNITPGSLIKVMRIKEMITN